MEDRLSFFGKRSPSDLYFLQLIRYIHQNPWRAGLVEDLKDYPDSSHLCYLEHEQKDWLYRDAVYQRFGKRRSVVIRKYTAFIDEKEEEASVFRNGEAQPDIIGDESFAETVRPRVEENIQIVLRWEDILKSVGAILQVNPEVLKTPGRQRKNARARAFIALFVEEFSVTSFQEIARFFKRDIVTISQGVSRLRNNLPVDANLRRQYDAIRNQLTK